LENSSPSASPEFEGRGGEEVNLELTQIMKRIFNTKNVLDLSKLCIYSGQKCWVIFIDVMV
jgi:exosome complex component RRP42